MRHQGLLHWTRNAKGRIVKRPNQYERLSPASSITEAGDGATNDYPRGAIHHINPVRSGDKDPED